MEASQLRHAHGSGRVSRLFSLDLPTRTPLERATSRVSPLLERVFALSKLNRIYDRVAPGGADGFLERVLKDLDVHYEVCDEDIAKIPARGPLVVVANHPFGGLEGMILAHLLHRVRPDVRVMANFLLGRIPELRELFICVDPFGSERSVRFNVRPLRESLRWLKEGGVLAVFPAGEVAHLELRQRSVVEPPWSQTVARIVRRANASVLPVFFDGQNGPLFQVLGLVHPRLRTALLPRQLINKGGRTIDVRVGSAIASRRLCAIEDDGAMTDYLRQRMLLLRHRVASAPVPSARIEVENSQPIAPADDPATIAAEIQKLPPEQLLVEGGEHRVYVARARQIPRALNEIGRLRETTYRATGEGTGKPLDLDKFDRWYRHLILWDATHRQIVGAYRLGLTDKILARRGIAGLYTSTLFNFDRALVQRFTPALELGRAFVRAEYQRGYAPLLLLWKGIARFVVLHPWYKILFGPVSISNEYQSASRELMVRFLQSNHVASDLSRLTRARNPFHCGKTADVVRLVSDAEDIDQLISELEPDHKGMPVLLRQYLKLGARFFSFNVDRGFGNAIDALMFVDLSRTDGRILDRYMGKDGARGFLAQHRVSASEANRIQQMPGAY